MPYELSDVTIGTFTLTQKFGERSQFYNARFGIKAHNGIDIGTPLHTAIVAAADGFVSEKGFDAAGYGNYVKLVHNGFLTLYGHLNDIQVMKGDRIVSGQLIGHSGQTGLADGAHLHFGVAPCDANGIKTELSNGYAGYIDPLSDRCHWTITNLQAPVTHSAEDRPPVAVPFDEYPKIIAEGSSFVTIGTYAVSSGVNEFLATRGIGVIDMQNDKSNPENGKKIVEWIAYLLEHTRDLESRKPQDGGVLTPEKQASLFDGLKKLIDGFVYVGDR